MSICVWTAELTPSKYPISVAVTSLTAISPEPSDTNARETVKPAAPTAVDKLAMVIFLVSVAVMSSITNTSPSATSADARLFSAVIFTFAMLFPYEVIN